ncbi:MAG: glycosyltransferase [Cyanobacteria bacterium P01_C01_bin.70]
MPKVSVILNTYNSAKFILETVSTVQNQTLSDFELLIIDDGSTDDTLEIVSSIKDSRIQIYSYDNAGIAKSRNRGLSHSSAEFIAFLDHDDLWHECKLENQWRLLIEVPDACLACSWIEMISESGNFIRYCSTVSSNNNVHKKILTKNFLQTASNPLMRKEHILRVGGFDEDIYGADDWDLFIRLISQAPIVISPRYEVYYRIVKGSGSANVGKIEQGCLRVIDKAFDKSPVELYPIKQEALGVIYQFLCYRLIEEVPNSLSGIKAFKYLAKSYQYRSSLWSSWAIAKVFSEAALISGLPPQLSRYVLTTAKSLMPRKSGFKG